MDVLECFDQGCGHLFVEVVVALLVFLQSVVDEVFCAQLIDVVLQPWQIETIQTETDQIEKRFYVIYRLCFRLHQELPH